MEPEEQSAGGAAGRTGWARVLIAGIVPAALGVAVWLSIFLGLWSHLLDSLTAHLSCQQGKMGCLGLDILGALTLVVALAALVGPLLRLAGVRPAWPIVLTGPPIVLILSHAYQSSPVASAFRLPGLSLGVGLALSYAGAALLTAPGARPYWRITFAIAIIALLPLSTLWSPNQPQPVTVNVQPGTGGSAPSAPAIPATGSLARGRATH
jgi:hypothetical protein